MTVGELNKILDGIPEDFEIEIQVNKKTDNDIIREFSKINKNWYDIGWSEEKIKLIIEIKEI
jgi:hypothetical protein